MDRERWEQIEKLFHAAWQVPAERREIFLAGRCGGDDDMRRAVDALLNQASSGAFDVADRQAAQSSAGQDPTETMLLPGAAVGPYRMEGPLGRGEWEKSTGRETTAWAAPWL